MNPERSISASNVNQLAQRWEIEHFAAFESTPAIVDGVIYVTNGNSLYAFNLRTGKEIWHFNDPPQKKTITISSSVAVDSRSHIAYYGTPDAHVYAINTLNGTKIWNKQLGDSTHGAYIRNCFWEVVLLQFEESFYLKETETTPE